MLNTVEHDSDTWVEVSHVKCIKQKPSTPSKQNKSNNKNISKKSNSKSGGKRNDISNGKGAQSEKANTKCPEIINEIVAVESDNNERNETALPIDVPSVKVNAWADTSNTLSVIKAVDVSKDHADDRDLVDGFNRIRIDNNDRMFTQAITPTHFSQILRQCHTYKSNSDNEVADVMTFHTRGLVNSGCACFRNCILQALRTLRPFMSLVSEVLRTVGDLSRVPDPEFSAWRELLTLMQEFTAVHQAPAPAAVNKQQLKRGVSGGKVVGQGRTDCISANHFMFNLFSAFQRQADASRPKGAFSSAKRAVSNAVRNGSQEDAMEFLTFLLDALHEEAVKQEAADLGASPTSTSDESNGTTLGTNSDSDSSSSSAVMVDSIEVSSAVGSSEEGEEDGGWSTVTNHRVKVVVDDASRQGAIRASGASVVNSLFHGTLRSEVRYRSKRLSSVTFQRFFCITLDVASSLEALRRANSASDATMAGKLKAGGQKLSVEQCLDLYFSEEVIDENEIRKQASIDTLPTILVLQLSRFAFDYRKNASVKITQEVSYPATLTLPERYLSPELGRRVFHTGAPHSVECAEYELRAVVLHHGEKASNGHYSTLAKELRPRREAHGSHRESGEEVWRSFNDTKVSVVSEAQATAAHSMAYVLFYTRIMAAPASRCSSE